MSDRSTFLFATPSFLEGIARLVDFGGGLQEFNSSEDEAQADARATAQDWAAVGDDLRAAAKAYR